MNKHFIAVILLAALVTNFSCKGKKTNGVETDTTTIVTPPASGDVQPAPATASGVKTYTVTVAPDTALLGTNRELLIKIKNLNAVELSNPDGGITGIKLSYDFDVTNNNKIGNSETTVNPADFRLELDNGTKISHDNSNSVNVDAESTATSTGNDFVLPKGTKPTALDLFFNDTRVVLKMDMK